MTRDELKERLLKAGLPEEVVDAKLAATSDEDLVRMKEIPAALVNDPTEDNGSDIVLDESVVKAFGQVVADVLKEVDYGIKEIEVDVPELKQLVADVVELKETVGKLVATIAEISKSDEERLKELNEDLSPAQRLRIRYAAGGSELKEASRGNGDVKSSDGTIVDGSGRIFASISEMVFGSGGE